MGPRDTPVGMPYPVDWRTGEIITDAQHNRLNALRDAHRALLEVMHFVDGTQADAERFGSRVMAIAATQIELGMEMALKAAMEHK